MTTQSMHQEAEAILSEIKALATFAAAACDDARQLGNEASEVAAVSPRVMGQYFDAIGRLAGLARAPILG